MSSAPGEWGTDDHAAVTDLQAAMPNAVRGALQKRADAIAAAAVEQLLQGNELDGLRAIADEAARSVLLAPASANEPELYYPDLPSFVEQQLVPMYRRPLAGNDVTWCAEWWRHAEAIARLEALWRAWEHLRLDAATGMSVWFRDHADHHMAVLLSADGPFRGCKPERHGDRLPALPLTPPPEGLFG